jgi:hypothetical protein
VGAHECYIALPVAHIAIQDIGGSRPDIRNGELGGSRLPQSGELREYFEHARSGPVHCGS